MSGIPASVRIGRIASAPRSTPSCTATTCSSTNWLAQAIDLSGDPSLVQRTTSNGRPFTPPSFWLTYSTAIFDPTVSSGTEKAAPPSSLRKPILIGSPVATLSGSVETVLDAGAAVVGGLDDELLEQAAAATATRPTSAVVQVRVCRDRIPSSLVVLRSMNPASASADRPASRGRPTSRVQRPDGRTRGTNSNAAAVVTSSTGRRSQ